MTIEFDGQNNKLGTTTANSVVIKTNDTDAITVDSSQNTTLAGNIDVSGNASADIINVYNASPQGRLNVSNNGAEQLEVFPGDVSNKVTLQAFNRSTVASNSFRYFASTHEFTTGGSERMRILSNGNVGIGTSSADAKLHIMNADAGALITSNSDEFVIENTSATGMTIGSSNTGEGHIYFSDSDDGDVGTISYFHSSNYMQFRVNAAERMRIDSSGDVIVGGNLTGNGIIKNKSGDQTAGNPQFTFVGNVGTGMRRVSTDNIAFDTGSVERMRITSNGGVLIGTTTETFSGGFNLLDNPGSTGTSEEEGWAVTNQAAVYHQTHLPNQMLLNDSSASPATHNYIIFRYNGATIGDIDTTDNTTVRYNTFTGGHWSQFHDGTNPELKKGTVMSLTGDKLEYSKCEKTITKEDGTEEVQKFEIAGTHEIGSEVTVPNDEYGEENSTTTATVVSNSIADHLVKVKVSDSIADKAVYGVWAGKYNDGDLSVEALGTSKIRIKQGEVLEVGDLLESAGDGTAQKQSDDTIKNSTIAKVTSPTVIETFDDNSFLVSCVLYCG